MKKILLLMILFFWINSIFGQVSKLYKIDYDLSFIASGDGFTCRPKPSTYDLGISFNTNYASDGSDEIYSLIKSYPVDLGIDYAGFASGSFVSKDLPVKFSFSDNFIFSDNIPLNLDLNNGMVPVLLCGPGGLHSGTEWRVIISELDFNIKYTGNNIICGYKPITFTVAASPKNSYELQATNYPNDSSSWRKVQTLYTSSITFNQNELPPSVSQGVPTYFRIIGVYEGFNIQSNLVGITFYRAIPFPQNIEPISPICSEGKGSLLLNAFLDFDGSEYTGDQTLTFYVKKDGGSPSTPIFSNDISVTVPDLEPGNYTGYVENAGGTCSKEFKFVIDPAPPALTSTISGQSPVCSSGTGSVTASGSGGTPPYQYSLNGSAYQSSNVFTGLTAGSYTVTVKDANGCVSASSNTINITAPAAISLSETSKTSPTGYGLSNGQFSVSATGGSGGYTYTLDGVSYQPSNTFTGLSAGTYNIRAKDGNGCESTPLAITLTEPSPLSLAISTQTNNPCYGENSGAITISASGGVAPYQYSLNSGSWQGSGSFSGLPAGSYTLAVKDNNGNTATTTTTITQPGIVTASITKTDAGCYLGNGTITISSPSGGSNLGYVYSIDNGGSYQGTNTFTVPAGSYTVKIKDSNGCTSTAQTITIAQPASTLQLSGTAQQASCYGSATGSVTLTATGGSGSYTYSKDNWASSNATGTFNNLTAGSYTFQAKDQNGCTASINLAITQPQELQLHIDNQTDASCYGGTGTITVSTTGGEGSITYSASPSLNYTNGTFSGPAGSYTLTATDANGCNKNTTVTIGQPSQLTATATPTAVSCNNATDGKVVLSATGGTGSYSYALKNIGNFGASNTFTNLPVGTHTFTIKDQNGCTTDINATIAQPDEIALTISNKQNISCNGAANGNFTVNATGGTGSYTYKLNGTDKGNTSTFTGLAPGNHTITATDDHGCTQTISTTISEPPVLSLSITNQTDNNCYGSNGGSLTLAATGGTAPYQYSIDGTNYQGSNTFSTLTAGSYTLTVKDANSCTQTLTTTIAQPQQLNLSLSTTKINCYGDASGTINATAGGGVGPYQYSIDGTNYQLSNQFQNLTAGSYTITIKDQHNCQTSQAINVEHLAPQLTLQVDASSPATCDGLGTITVSSVTGGTAPYSYSNDGINYSTSPTFTNLNTGTYTIYVKDANGCTATVTKTITVPTKITAQPTKTDALCFSSNSGSITINNAGGGNGNYQYSIDGTNFQASNTFNNLAAGNYTFTIKDIPYTCQLVSTITIGEPTKLNLSLVNQADINCHGAAEGSIAVSASGGTAPYQYSINNGNYQNSPSYNNLTAGNYTLTVKDANGCTQNLSVTLTEPQQLSINLAKTDINCFGEATGSITTTATGGVAPYQYSIDGNTFQLSNQFQNLPAGNYTITIKDKNNCQASGTITLIDVAPKLVLQVNAVSPATCEETGSITISSVTGGTAPYTYSIDGNTYSSAQSFNNLSSGQYTTYVKDANGCTASVTKNISVPSGITAQGTTTPVTCFSGNTGNIKVTNATGGSGSYQYSINGTDFQSSAIFSNLTAGNYTITVKDSPYTCSYSFAITVSEPQALSLSLTNKIEVSCYGSNTGSLTVSATGGTAPYQYNINNGTYQNSSTFTTLIAGNYTITVKDANGCTQTLSTNIAQPQQLGLSLFATKINCFGDASGAITATTTGGVAPYQYSLDGNTFQLGNQFHNLTAGTYTITIKDQNNCQTSQAINVEHLAPKLTPQVDASSPATCDGLGTITVSSVNGGTAPYTYSIDGNNYSSSNSFTNLNTGQYTIYIKDVNGCTTSVTKTITVPTKITAQLTKTDALCFSGNSGSITISNVNGGNGSYQYSINGIDFQASNIFNGLTAGTYTVTVQDSPYSCRLTTNITIGQPTQLDIQLITKTNISCNGQQDGQITVSANSGTAPYQYSIDGTNYSPSGTFSTLKAGTYSLSVKDANSCIKSINVELTEPLTLNLALNTKTDVSCFGAKDGSLTLIANGGTTPYTYALNNGAFQTANQFNQLAGGIYALTVKDAKGCTVNTTVTISENQILQLATTGFRNLTCRGNQTGEITVAATGGSGTYQYAIDNGSYQTSPVFRNLSAGNHTLSVKDNNGCQATVIQNLTEPAPLTVTKNIIQQKCFDNCDGEITLTVAGGTPPYTYQWLTNPSYGNTPIIGNLCGGLYKVRVTDANGCFVEDQAEIRTPIEIRIPEAIRDTVLCVGQTITYDAGNIGYSYHWTADNGFNRTTQKVELGEKGTYQLKITNNIGCSITKTFKIESSTTLLKANFLASSYANVGDTVILVDVSKPTPAKNSWIMDNGIIEVSSNAANTVKQLTFAAPGVYNIMMMANLGQCADAVQKSITVLPREQKTEANNKLGYREELIREFRAYPNPNGGEFRALVKLSEKMDIRVGMYGFAGDVIVEPKLHPKNDSFEIGFDQRQIPPGIYVLTLEAGNETRTIKVIKL